MAIQLYRKGTTHTVRGVECELGNFSPRDIDLRLSEGWVKSETELNEVEETEVEEVKEDTINPVRVAAKEAGIEGWDSKRIKTLEAELSGHET